MVRKCRKAKGIVEAGVSSSTYMQLRSRRIVYVRSEKASSVADNEVSSSCCASNEYKNNEFIDLEEDKDGDTETSTYRRSTKRKLFENLREDDKESSKSMENHYSSEFDSVIKESSDCCCSGRVLAEEKTKTTTEQPTESEIDDFFAVAEKQLNEKFKKKNSGYPIGFLGLRTNPPLAMTSSMLNTPVAEARSRVAGASAEGPLPPDHKARLIDYIILLGTISILRRRSH